MSSAYASSPVVPSKVLEEIEGKIASGVAGKVLQEYTNGELKLSMWIPSDLAGRVIGKKGTVITNLQRETKTRLINALPRVGDSLWIAVVIIGELKNVFDACKAITEIVENEVDDVVLEFTINYRKPFFLYGGRKFAILKRISADTNVRIFFPEFNPKTQVYKDAQPVSLEGNSENVKRAMSLFEKEALIYQYVQANRSEKDRHGDAASTGTRDTESKEAKPSRRVAAPPAAATSTTATAAAAQQTASSPHASTQPPTSSGASAPTAASTEEGTTTGAGSGASKARNSSKNKVLDATGIERILREPKAPKPTHTDVTVTVAGTTEGTTTTKEVGAFTAGAGADGAEDSAAAAVPRAPAVKQEKIINIPTTLVGLLLSKRPKAKSTTINVIQQMTHTVISKMPPAGILPGRAGAASSPSEPGEGKDSAGDTTAPGAVSAGAGVEVEGSAVEGGGDVEAEKEGEAGSSKTTRRRRTVSEEDGGTESDGESADSTSTDAEEGGEGDGDDVSTEESIGGSDIESEDDLEGSDEENFVDATTEPVTFLPASVSEKEAGVALSVEFGVHQDEKEGGADEKAEAGVETAVEADVEGDVITTATAAAVPAATSDGTVAPVVAVEERKTLKMLMIAESERLGFVSFRVVGYFPENVDMVVEALQSIIRGDRIMEVMEKLRADSRGLKWPPKDALRKERFDKNDALRERPERPERVDGERPSGSSKYKSRDSELRVRAPKPKRREYRDGVSGGAEGDDDAGAATGGGVGEEGGFPAERVVSSRYKGKKAFKKDREGVDPADPASGGATSAEGSSVFKRAPRGPPKLGEDGKPKLPIRGNKFVRNTATAAASAGGDAPSNN